MKFFKLGQKKTVYIAKDLTYHRSKKGIEVGFIDLESLQQSPIPDTFKGISVVKEVVGEIQAL